MTPRTADGNIKIIAMVDVFTRFARALTVPDEKAETIARVLIDEWISVFGPMESLLSDRGPNLLGCVVDELTSELGIRRFVTYRFHPEPNGAVERWNRTVARDLASFVSTGSLDWDAHVALAAFRYNTDVCEATRMTPYRAMFGVDAFEAWGEVIMGRDSGEPESLPKGLALLHKALRGRAMSARTRAASLYNRVLKQTTYSPGDRVLLWSTEIESQEGKKVIKPWIGPYTVTAP